MFKKPNQSAPNPLIWFIVCLTFVVVAYSPIGPAIVGIWENAEVTIRFGSKSHISQTVDTTSHKKQ